MCSEKDVKAAASMHENVESDDTENDGEEAYRLNIWRIKTRHSSNPKYSDEDHDFKARVMINNKLVNLLVDTGAKVSVCGMNQAASWGILDQLQPSAAKIRPYQSEPIAVRGISTCSVTFNNRSVPVEFHVLPGSCEPILAGNQARQLNIISFNNSTYVFKPVSMIQVNAS